MPRKRVTSPSSQSRKFWVIRDRRLTGSHLYHALLDGEVQRYFTEDAARAASYPTEKVWEVTVNMVEKPK